jgi:hypothetical protein
MKTRDRSAELPNCQFCGSPAYAGGPDQISLLTGELCMLWTCIPCAQEMHRFQAEQLAGVPDDLPVGVQLKAIGKLRGQTERHMKQWVARKEPP